MNPLLEFIKNEPIHLLSRKACFDSTPKYQTFLNWISGEFDLFLQDDSNGLIIFFPEGKFHITNSIEKEKVIADINLQTKTLVSGQIVLDKILQVYNLFSKINS